MTDLPDITDDKVAAYRRDGVICLRGRFADWLETVEQGIERNMAEPGPIATEHKLDDGRGRFFEDYCNWDRIPEYRDFVRNSPAAATAARFMGSETVQIFHEHVLVKEPGTTKATVWHHDLPYYSVQGSQNISIWLALDPVPEAVTLNFVAGSHRWGKLYYPRLFDDGSNYAYKGGRYETVPDIDAAPGDYRILSWELEPGDAVLFDFLTLHSAPGNPCLGRRRGFSTRWLGDDACYTLRPGRTSPPYPEIGLQEGDRMREDWFPVVWRDKLRHDGTQDAEPGR